MIIDFHTHIFSPKLRENRERFAADDPSFNALYSNPQAKLASAEDLIASMDADGIDMSVVLNIGWKSPALCRATNDYIIESVSRFPNRLAGFCAVHPLSPGESVAEIDRCARSGIKGIGELRSDVQGFDLGDSSVMAPVAAAARQHNMGILTHASEPVGHIYPGKGSIAPGALYRFAANFPDQPLVFAHWGGGLPFYALMPEVATALKNVYFHSAASPFLYKPEIFEHIGRITGADHILFGSDFPLIKQSRIIKSLDALSISEDSRKMILGRNAQRLLGLA